MRPHLLLFAAPLLVLPLSSAPAARGNDVCTKLTEAEVSEAVGTPLKRSPTDPCRFGHALNSFSITMHAGGGSGYDGYIAQARKEFPEVQTVPGVGSKAAFYGFSLAVQYKSDLFVVQMFMGKSTPEKIALAKAVALKFISHL